MHRHPPRLASDPKKKGETMSTIPQKRKPAGSPTGGQFAASARPDDPVVGDLSIRSDEHGPKEKGYTMSTGTYEDRYEECRTQLIERGNADNYDLHVACVAYGLDRRRTIDSAARLVEADLSRDK